MLRLENMIFKVVANRKHGISKTLKQASINYNEESRERKSMNKKKILEAHRNYNYNTTDIIKKILTRKIQQYQ